MERKVYLQGSLAEKFGSEFTIYAESVADVWRCLNANFPELHKFLINCHEKDVGFICKVGEKSLEKDEELLLKMGEGDVFISPQPAGSKSAFGKILAAVLIVAAIYFTGGQILALQNAAAVSLGMAPTAVTFGSAMLATGTFGLMALGVAVNLALTGIQQLMAPDPSMDIPENTPESTYLFKGSEQTILEGDPVPVVYGELRVPGRPIGFELRNKNNVYSNYYSNGGYSPYWGGRGPYYNQTFHF